MTQTRPRRATQTSRPARPVDFNLSHIVDEMPPGHLECRNRKHDWDPITSRWDPKLRAVVSTERCKNCTSEHVYGIDLRGFYVDVPGGGTDYVEGYLMPKGTGVLTRDDRAYLRLRWVTQRLSPEEQAKVRRAVTRSAKTTANKTQSETGNGTS